MVLFQHFDGNAANPNQSQVPTDRITAMFGCKHIIGNTCDRNIVEHAIRELIRTIDGSDLVGSVNPISKPKNSGFIGRFRGPIGRTRSNTLSPPAREKSSGNESSNWNRTSTPESSHGNGIGMESTTRKRSGTVASATSFVSNLLNKNQDKKVDKEEAAKDKEVAKEIMVDDMLLRYAKTVSEEVAKKYMPGVEEEKEEKKEDAKLIRGEEQDSKGDMLLNYAKFDRQAARKAAKEAVEKGAKREVRLGKVEEEDEKEEKKKKEKVARREVEKEDSWKVQEGREGKQLERKMEQAGAVAWKEVFGLVVIAVVSAQLLSAVLSLGVISWSILNGQSLAVVKMKKN